MSTKYKGNHNKGGKKRRKRSSRHKKSRSKAERKSHMHSMTSYDPLGLMGINPILNMPVITRGTAQFQRPNPQIMEQLGEAPMSVNMPGPPQKNPSQPLYSTYQEKNPATGLMAATAGLGSVDFSKNFPTSTTVPGGMFDYSMLAKMDPNMQAIFANSNLKDFYSSMAPFGLQSAFMHHPFMNFMNNLQHVDQPQYVMNQEAKRPNMALFATSSNPKIPPPKNLEIITEQKLN